MIIWRLFLTMIQNDAHGKDPPLATPPWQLVTCIKRQQKGAEAHQNNSYKQSHLTVLILEHPPDLAKETSPNHFLVRPSA